MNGSASRAATPATLRAWLEERDEFALGLSSGFFGFFAHAGVLAALEESGLRPASFHGSSAGALIAACAAAGLAATEIREILFSLRRADFWDPDLRLGLPRRPGLLRGELFARKLEEVLPVDAFEACSRPLSVSVFALRGRETRVVSTGELIPAVVASCAVPLMFQPVPFAGELCWDGGLRDRAGIDGHRPPAPMLHHHLVSRSPWRRPDDPALRPPRAPGLVNLVIEGLVRVGPHRLARGPRAYEMARASTLRALTLPLVDQGVRLAG